MKKFTTVLMAVVLTAMLHGVAWGSEYSDHILGKSGLVAYYRFEEDSGTTADDANGTAAYDGTLSGITLPGDSLTGPLAADGFSGMGTSNKSFDFDGTTDYVTLGSTLASAIDGACSVALFAKLDSTGWARMFDTGNGVASNNYMTFGSITATEFLIASHQSGDIDQIRFTTGGALNDSAWHHIVVTRSGDGAFGDALSVYIDGVALSSYDTGSGSNVRTGSPRIGADAGDGSAAVNGRLDEVAIFNRVLSAGEVAKMYRVASPPSYVSNTYSDAVLDRSDLVAYYQFEEQSGTTADDAGGISGHDGTTTDIVLPGDSTNGPTVSDGFGGMDTGNDAFDFDGTADYVTLPSPVGWAIDGPSTIALFAQLDSTTWARMWDTGDAVSLNNYVTFGSHNGVGGFDVASYQNGGMKQTFYNTSLTLEDGGWHHVVVTRSGSGIATNELAVYIDGVALSYSGANTGGNRTGSPRIGADSANGTAAEVNGRLDEVAIFDTAMSAAEVAALYRASRTPWVSSPYADAITARSDLVAYYQFEEQSGTRVSSGLTPLSYDGTVAGGLALPGNSTNGPSTADGFTGMVSGNKAFDFSSNQRVTLGTPVATAMDGPSTVALFVQLDNTSWGRMFDTGDGGANANYMTFGSHSSGTYFDVASYQDGGVKQTFYSAGGALNGGGWHHVVVTRSGSGIATNELAVYIDGVALSYSGANTSGVVAGAPTIGASPTPHQPMDGRLDDVAIFNTALSASDVEELYRIAKPIQGTIILIK